MAELVAEPGTSTRPLVGEYGRRPGARRRPR